MNQRSYDKLNTDTYFYVDIYGMVLRKPAWKGQDDGSGDSISRTAIAYKAWGDIDLVYTIQACFPIAKDRRGKYLKPHRHPKDYGDDMSRDHILGALLALKFANMKGVLKFYAKHLRWRISKKFCFTPDLWAWMKMLAGKWWWGPVFFVISYFMMILYVLWNKFLYMIAPFSKEKHQLNWEPRSVLKITSRQFWLRSKVYKAYALEEFAWQLYVFRRNVFIRGLQWLALRITGKTNYLTRLLLGDKSVRSIDVEYYRQMTNWRWSTTLNETTSRHVEIIKNPEWIEANRLDEDLLKTIWNECKK